VSTVAAQSDIAIEVHGLSKSFNGRQVVRDLSMQVKRGSIYGFLGPNGSGKTTTIRMLCGLLTPDSGEGTCLGYDIRRDADKIKRHVGYMTQRFSLYQDLSVRENLEFVARLYGVPDPRKAAREMIKRIGLSGREEQLAGELSGGWKQRLALGACTLPNPQLLLLDEPTAGVDPKARREFWNEIHALAAEGLTVLVSTHYMDEAERCHEIAYIAYGNLLAHGTVEEVIAKSALTTYTVTGEGLNKLTVELTDKPGIDMVAPFGTSLHVSGRDEAELERHRALKSGNGTVWHKSEPSLEDVFIELMGRARTISNERSQSNQWRHSGILAAHLCDAGQGIPPASPRPGFIRDDRDVADHAAPAVRLCHQHHAASSADRRVAAGGQRPRALDPQGAAEHGLLPLYAPGPDVRNSIVCSSPARCCSASKFRAASSAASAAVTSPRYSWRRTRPIRWRPARRWALGRSCNGARARSAGRRSAGDAVRNPRPCAR
jgi:ABC-2 type transport system ATP-binding protein